MEILLLCRCLQEDDRDKYKAEEEEWDRESRDMDRG
jgi:hypothetical protein